MTTISMIGRNCCAALGLGAILLPLVAAPAAAQDEPAIVADPASVAAEGEQTFVVSGSGWGVPGVFVLSCDMPESGEVDGVDADSCDVGGAISRGPVDVVDGSFQVEVTFDVPAEGIAIAAGGNTNPDDPNDGEEQSAAVLVTVDGDTNGAAGESESAADATELPDTGGSSEVVAVLGFAALAAGLMIVFGTRRGSADAR